MATYSIDQIVARGNDAIFGDVTIITDVNNITTIDMYTFYLIGQTTTTPAYYIYTSSPGMTINGGVIATATFNSNSNIIGIFLSKGITGINNAFNTMTNLQYLQVLNGVLTINTGAFTGCTKLKPISPSLPYQGTIYTSLYATSVITNFFGTNNTNGFYLNIYTTPADSYTLIDIVNRGEYNPVFGDITIIVKDYPSPNGVGRPTLPGGVKSTGSFICPLYSFTFAGIMSLPDISAAIYTTSRTSPITSIAAGSFNGVNHLLGAFLSSSITTIESDVFKSTINLKYIEILNSVTSINSTAFIGSTTLKPISPSLPYIGTIYTSTPPTEYISNFFNNNGFYLNFLSLSTNVTPPVLCFKEGSKILYYNRKTNQEQYIEIEKLKKGDIVKTFLHRYKKIEHIGNSKMYNNVNNIRSMDKLYKCSKTQYPELFEDLIITGAHSILVNDFKDNEKEKTLEVLSDIYVTDKKYRLPACIDKRAQIYEVEGNHTIWHFSLEHDDYYMNYGVFANGLLVETASNYTMLECSGLNIV
uniref:Hedgehog/Intein (Hint) domain-containing protein n=1 Tax=viral metagenome TaxID=1070528 RepID=A0A6C0EW79_9ZZZZ